ncbi:MAG: DUF4381 domain-containing protein [Magnetococcales bacterium]|nr:DUF4381 domain-containing protein [Magnetococcales bacterium]
MTSPDAPPLPLRDIHLPDPISWWPPAWGWWAATLTLLLLLASGLLLRYRAKRHRLRAAALAELSRIRQGYALHQDPRLLATELSALLRRVSLLRHPRHEVAGLSGEAWLTFLDRGWQDRRVQDHKWQGSPFSQGEGRALISAPFEPDPLINAEALLELCKNWIRNLPPEPRRPSRHSPPPGPEPHP